MLKAGVLGLGVMGRHHSRVLTELDGVDFIGVFDPGVGSGVPEEISCQRVYKELEDLLALKPVYCVVSSSTVYHLEWG